MNANSTALVTGATSGIGAEFARQLAERGHDLVLGAAAAHTMIPRGHGQIITVASLASWVTQGAYSAIKAFAKVWSEGLSVDLAGTGVTATALCPGWVTTEFHQRAGLAGQARSIPTWAWVSPQRCVREALIDADKGKVLSIPTKRWKIAAFLLQHLPASAVQAISRRLAASKVQ